MVWEIFVGVILLGFFAGLYFRYSKAGVLISKVPGPKPWPLIGNALDICLDSEKLFQFTRDMQKKYGGSISRLTGMHLRAINIYEPEDIEVILSSTKFNEKYYPYNFLQPWLGNGLLVNNGLKWQHRRKLLTPAFHFNILRKFTSTFTEHVEELLQLVQHEVGKPQTDIGRLITQATLKIICETSMGNILEEDKSSKNYFQALHTLGQCVIHRIMNAHLYPTWIYSLSSTGKSQKKALDHLHTFTTNVIKKRRVRNEQIKIDTSDNGIYGSKNKMAMLDLLLEEEKAGNIDEEGIREEVDTFMFEGHDTTSASLCFMIMRIANEPEIQDKIYEELQQIFGDSDRVPTIHDLNEMKYLERCVKESLRLYPGVPFIARYLCEDVVLNGYKIPANTNCNIQIFDIHRREKLFPDPERFDPDRFLPENVVNRHPYAYIPFSAGPRNCIGQKFAMLEMKTVMSGLIRKFRLEPVTTPRDIVYLCDLVLKSKHPIFVKFFDRKHK